MFLLTGLLTAVMIGLGLLVTHVLVHVWPFTLEEHAARALYAMRTPALDRLSDAVSWVAYTTGLAIAIVIAGGAMRLAYRRWREALFLAAAMLAEFEVFMLTAWVVARARPPIPKLDNFPELQSFPSGHVTAAVALYGGIAVVLYVRAKRKALALIWGALLFIVPVAVAISRFYRGMHYPTDVAGSFVSSLGCLWILQRAMLTPIATSVASPELLST